jgi:AraC-like DNA-binding protein
MARAEAGQARGLIRGEHALPRPGAHRRLLPAADLRPFVERFWLVSWNLRGHRPQTVETLPHPSVHLVLESGQPARLGGVHGGRFSRVLAGQGRVFGIKFRPGGFRPFWHAPMTTLTDRTLSLAGAFGAPGAAFEAAIHGLDGDDARMAAAETFLRARQPSMDGNVALIDGLVARVIADRALTRVEDLAALSGLGLRALQRLFAEYVGITPKWLIQRYRLHEALARRDTAADVEWAGVALALGYFDQAHFIRDFKRMVGTTPARYAARARGGL